jgi:pyruvate dehydrogenase E2 component (dihydrolipoamide acetyltransferase)
LAEVTLPSLGESVTEGIITKWFKKVGDVVARDEVLFEVSTDKVDSEMPSPATGVLQQILAAEGDTVQTGSVIAVIGEEGVEAAPVVSTPADPVPSPTPIPARVSAGPSGVVVSPVVRRILADGGVDLSTVKGTGIGGAITRRDAERAVAQGPSESLAVELSRGQRRMGAHMSASALAAPHGFVAIDIEVPLFSSLSASRAASREGAEVTDEVVVAVAAVRALKEFNYLNAYYVDGELTIEPTINVGLVRHVDGDGMLVPVVHAAAGLSVGALAQRVIELDQRLGQRVATADDLLGGTFTVAGAPSAHALWSVPILIQPQVAVLSVGAVREVPVVVRDGGEVSVRAGHRLALGLTFDHRVCDSVAGAAFLERVGEILNTLDVASEW